MTNAITKSLDSASIASATAISMKQQNENNSAQFRPEKIVCIGQVQTGKKVDFNKPFLASGNADDIGTICGFGSPLHRMALKLYPKSLNGSKVDTYFLPIEAPKTADAEVKTLTITATGVTKSFSGYIKFKDMPFEAAADIAGKVATAYQLNPAQAPRKTDLNAYETTLIPFSLLKGMSASEVAQAIFDVLIEETGLPFIPTIEENVLTLSAKWAGQDSKFDIEIVDAQNNIIASETYGVTFEITTTTEAAGVGEISDEALATLDEEFGVTRVVCQYSTTEVLNQLQEKFDAFHDPLIAQFVICYTSIEAPEHETVKGTYDKEKLIATGTARRDDYINVQIVGDYGNLRKLNYGERNQLLKAGYSNLVKKSDGSYRLEDLVTFYHPVGKQNPLFRFDRDVTVIANCAYSLMSKFRDSEEWKSVILIAEEDLTNNPAARKLSDVKAAVNTQIGLLGKAGLIANYKNAQKRTTLEIDATNPNRVNINPRWEITGVARIFDLVNFVGFYFGG
ncbi:hypothetical protein IJX73_02920 [bacterium]|nr:hypothetical protein [bacterium]